MQSSLQASLTECEFFYLNRIIADLYSEKNHVHAFNVFLEQLKHLVFFEKGDVYFYSYKDDQILFEDFIFINWNEQDLGSYLDVYCSMDDVLPIVANKQPIMFRSSDVFITSEREKTQYYSELLKPAGMDYSIEGNLYVSESGHVGGIGIHRSSAHEDFSPKDLTIMKLVRPHLSNIAKWYQDSKAEEKAYLRMIPFISNLKDLGICIWDFDLNRLDSSLDENGFMPAEHREELLRALLTLCRGLRENILRHAGNQVAEDCRMKSKVSIGSKSYFADVTYSLLAGENNGRFIAMVYDYGNIFQNLLTDLREKYSLTDREFQVLQCMLNGRSNQQIAGELFITIPTVKKHLTNIYQKMEIEGKHQLLNALM